MIQILASGFKISSADKLALENDLLITPFQWLQDCVKGMINKSVKTMLRTYLDELKAGSPTISANKAILVQQIDSLIQNKKLLDPEFSESLVTTASLPEIDRTGEANIELFPDGLSIESWEKLALDHYYKSPEDMIRWFMANKIQECRKRFVKNWQTKIMNESLMPSIPSNEDAFIDAVVQLPSYMNRAENEAANLL